MQVNEFSVIYERLCFAFDKEIKKGQVMVYYDYLGRIELNSFVYAVDKCILYGKFFPKISELIDYSREYKEHIPPERQIESKEKVMPMPEEVKQMIKDFKMKGLD